MPCTAGELCTLTRLTPGPPESIVAGFTAFVARWRIQMTSDNPMHRVCHEGCRERPRGRAIKYRQGGPGGGTVKEREIWFRKNGQNRVSRVAFSGPLEVLQLLDRRATHNTIAGRFKCGLRTFSRVREERRPVYHPGAGSKPKHYRWRWRLRSRPPTGKACQAAARTLR